MRRSSTRRRMGTIALLIGLLALTAGFLAGPAGAAQRSRNTPLPTLGCGPTFIQVGPCCDLNLEQVGIRTDEGGDECCDNNVELDAAQRISEVGGECCNTELKTNEINPCPTTTTTEEPTTTTTEEVTTTTEEVTTSTEHAATSLVVQATTTTTEEVVANEVVATTTTATVLGEVIARQAPVAAAELPRTGSSTIEWGVPLGIALILLGLVLLSYENLLANARS